MAKYTSRRPYTDYPESYFELLEALAEEPSKSFTYTMPYREASSLRRDFYRFRLALGTAAKTDTYAEGLADSARDVNISIQPNKVYDKDTPVEVTFKMNPLSRLRSPKLRVVEGGNDEN